MKENCHQCQKMNISNNFNDNIVEYQQKNKCEYLAKGDNCPYLNDTKSKTNKFNLHAILHHLSFFDHFDSFSSKKLDCKNGTNCHPFQNIDHDIDDNQYYKRRIHMRLFKHPARMRRNSIIRRNASQIDSIFTLLTGPSAT